MRFLLAALLISVGISSAQAADVIGSAAAGCVVDAQPLSLGGTGYQVLRPSRNRYWGHPVTIGFVQSLAAAAQAEGGGGLLIADMARPKGGPMPSGHASHQNGLDVDIWLRRAEHPLTMAELESPKPIQMVQGSGVSDSWTSAQARLIELAARAPGVDRIFVNPAIKQTLCVAATGSDRGWLGKLRPWWGHDEHFHVRMSCPAESLDCEAQKPFPEGDGCGGELESWLAKPTSPAPPDRPHVQTRQLPEACVALLKVK